PPRRRCATSSPPRRPPGSTAREPGVRTRLAPTAGTWTSASCSGPRPTGSSSTSSTTTAPTSSSTRENKPLLTDILRGAVGIPGFVQSDWELGMRDATKAALAGQCVEMPLKNVFRRFLAELVQSGEVPGELVDEAALRILRQQVRFAPGRDPRTS